MIFLNGRLNSATFLFHWICRKLFFSDANPMILTGRRKPLEANDVIALPESLNPRSLPEGFHRLSFTTPRTLILGIIKTLFSDIKIQVFLVIGMTACQLLLPLVIEQLLLKIDEVFRDQVSMTTGLLFIVFLAALSLASSLLGQHYLYRSLNVIQKIVNGLNVKLYQKALVLSQGVHRRRSMGDILNHIGTDTDHVAEGIWALVEILYSILVFIGVSVLLYHYLGLAAIIGLSVVIILSPIGPAIAKKHLRLDRENLHYRDLRINLLSQIFSAMRLVKYFAWEPKLEGEVEKVRGREISIRTQNAKLSSVSHFIFTSIRILVCLISFGIYVMLGYEMEAPLVFACLALFSALDQPFASIAHHTGNITRAKAAADRIISFMRLPETSHCHRNKETQPFHSVGIALKNIKAHYEGDHRTILKSLNLTIQAGEKIAVVGPIGSGKSSLLQLLLGELKLEHGQMEWLGISSDEHPRIAYVPQEAFIFANTIRQNIVLDHNVKDIDTILHLTCLEDDLERFPEGVDTHLGENGVNLSGGQKQRISLARAVAAQPGLVLLDDPLSAVDPFTEDRLVERLLFREWKEVTCLMVTHRLKYLKSFDRIIFMHDGTIAGIGSFKSLLENCAGFRQFMLHEHTETSVSMLPVSQPSLKPSSNLGSAVTKATGFIKEEDRERDAVKWRIYQQYFRAMTVSENQPNGDFKIRLGLILTVLACGFIPILQNTWISFWTRGGIDPSHWGLSSNVDWNLIIYSILSILFLFSTFIQNRFWSLRSIQAGRYLHQKALKSILNATIDFFDTTPVGRILNRFSGDTDAVERDMAWAFKDMIYLSMQTFLAVVTILIVVPFLIPVMPFILIVYAKLQHDYRASSRELKRLVAISRSPRFVHLKESMEGLISLRAYRRTPYYIDRFYQCLESYQQIFHGLIMANRWFSSRIPFLSSIVLILTGVGVLFLAKWQWIEAGVAGLAIIYARSFSHQLNEAVRAFSETEARLTSVERLNAFGSLPGEEPVDNTKMSNWQIKAGEIRFEDVSMRYRRGQTLALNQVSFTIPAGEKVGVLGKTGSGKSTIFQNLFRFYEVESGKILIDQQDISQIPLRTLRSQIAMIPQDPVLFTGTLRDNLDRFQQYSDEDIWKALDQVYLKQEIEAFPLGLNTSVFEGGKNFSQGQRQLLCFARALLVDAKIIALDEATASVDVVTDAKIHQILAIACRGKTILLIAHRLETLKDCSMLIHLEYGKVAKIDRPKSRKDIGKQNLANYRRSVAGPV